MLTLRPTVCFKATSLNKINTQTPFDVFLAEAGNTPAVHTEPATKGFPFKARDSAVSSLIGVS